jgi:Oxidoreductase molybdopterin binding domain
MIFHRIWLAVALFVLNLVLPSALLCAAEDPPQAATHAAENASTSLRVIDESSKTHVITTQDFAKLPHRSVSAKIGQVDSTCEGVSLVDLLESAGVTFGKELRGPRAANVIVLEAQDGYRTALSQFEIDPETNDKVALVVDSRDGKPLADQEGPYRLIIPAEKRPVRWVRMLRTIRVLSLTDTPLGESHQ